MAAKKEEEEEDEISYIKWILDLSADDLEAHYNDLSYEFRAEEEQFREFIACIKFHQDIIEVKKQFVKKVEDHGHSLDHYDWFQHYWLKKQMKTNEEIEAYKKDIDRMSYLAMHIIYRTSLQMWQTFIHIPKPLVDIVRRYLYE